MFVLTAICLGLGLWNIFILRSLMLSSYLCSEFFKSFSAIISLPNMSFSSLTSILRDASALYLQCSFSNSPLWEMSLKKTSMTILALSIFSVCARTYRVFTFEMRGGLEILLLLNSSICQRSSLVMFLVKCLNL